MRLRTVMVVLVAAYAGVVTAVGDAAPARSQEGTPEQRTHPHVHPSHGTRRSAFKVTFTLRSAPGHHGVVATGYRVQVDPPSGSRAACSAPQPATVETGERDSTAKVPLPSPQHGWCRGRYAVTVFLQSGPYCPPPQDGQPPRPCPAFASRDLDVGETSFLVRPVHHTAHRR